MLLLETPFSTRFDVSKPPCSETFQRPPFPPIFFQCPLHGAWPPWLPASGSPTALNPPGLRPAQLPVLRASLPLFSFRSYTPNHPEKRLCPSGWAEGTGRKGLGCSLPR